MLSMYCTHTNRRGVYYFLARHFWGSWNQIFPNTRFPLLDKKGPSIWIFNGGSCARTGPSIGEHTVYVPMYFLPWIESNAKCAEFDSNSGEWNDVLCHTDDENIFVCEREDFSITDNSHTDKEASKEGLTEAPGIVKWIFNNLPSIDVKISWHFWNWIAIRWCVKNFFLVKVYAHEEDDRVIEVRFVSDPIGISQNLLQKEGTYNMSEQGLVNGKRYYKQVAGESFNKSNPNNIWFVENFGGNEYLNWIIGRNIPKGIGGIMSLPKFRIGSGGDWPNSGQEPPPLVPQDVDKWFWWDPDCLPNSDYCQGNLICVDKGLCYYPHLISKKCCMQNDFL